MAELRIWLVGWLWALQFECDRAAGDGCWGTDLGAWAWVRHAAVEKLFSAGKNYGFGTRFRRIAGRADGKR